MSINIGNTADYMIIPDYLRENYLKLIDEYDKEWQPWFLNMFPKQVELWFYHVDDSLRWIAHSMHKINSHKKYTWTLPSGWKSAQVRFTGPGKWYTVSAGETIIINENGVIDHYFKQ